MVERALGAEAERGEARTHEVRSNQESTPKTNPILYPHRDNNTYSTHSTLCIITVLKPFSRLKQAGTLIEVERT